MSVIPRINIENIKNEINKTLGESYKQKLYWDSFRKFALSKLSKREWDSCVRDLLGARPENVAIHNTLVRSMLANARYSYNKEDYKVDIEALKAKYHQQQQQQQQQQQLLQEQQSLYNESIAASSIGKVVKAKPSKRIHPYEVPLAAPSTPLTPIEDESKPLRRRKLKATVSQVPPSPTMVSTPTTTTTTTTTLMTPIPKVRATVSTPTREKKGKNVLGAPPSTVNGTASPPTKKSGKGVLKRAHAEAAEAQSVAAVPEQELKKKKVKRGLASTSEAVPPQAAASAMAVPPLPGSAAAAAAAAATAAAAMAAMPVPMQPVPAIPLAPVIPEFVPPPAENPFFFQETFYTGPVNAQGKPIPSISTRPGASDLLRQELPTLFEFLQQPTPELPDREAIQTRMKKIADESDLKDVAPECAEVMQRSMEFYLKQIISKCLELKRKPQSLRLQHLLRQQRQQQYQYQSPAAATSGSTTNRLLLNINTNRSRLSPAPTMVGGSIPLANGNNFDASAQQQQLRAGTYAAPPITSASSSPPAGTMATITTTTTTTSIPGVDHIITPRDLLTTIDICPYLLGEDHEKFREKISMTNWDLC